MKRIIAFVLALCLCASLCACGNGTPSTDTNQTNQNQQTNQNDQNEQDVQPTEPIYLTTANWSEYLEIEIENLAFRTETITPMGQVYATGYVDYEVRVHSKSETYTFTDVVIKVRVLSESAEWTERARDSELSLSADGAATVTETLKSAQGAPEKVLEPELIFEVRKISGTVKVSP